MRLQVDIKRSTLRFGVVRSPFLSPTTLRDTYVWPALSTKLPLAIHVRKCWPALPTSLANARCQRGLGHVRPAHAKGLQDVCDDKRLFAHLGPCFPDPPPSVRLDDALGHADGGSTHELSHSVLFPLSRLHAPFGVHRFFPSPFADPHLARAWVRLPFTLVHAPMCGTRWRGLFWRAAWPSKQNC